MHHSQLEYLIAVQKLQGEEMGAQGTRLAEQMDVSTGYILKLTKAAEQKGYIRRGKARSVYITEQGKVAIREYLLAAQRLCGKEHDAGSVGAVRKTGGSGKLKFFAPVFAYANMERRKQRCY